MHKINKNPYSSTSMTPRKINRSGTSYELPQLKSHTSRAKHHNSTYLTQISK